MKNKIVIGSRESVLAVLQSEMVLNFLKERHPKMDVSLLTMKTTGDKILDRTLDQVGGKGLFVKELDRALLDKRSDLSVHSLKDMPMEVPKELPILCFSRREDPRDVLVFPKGADGPDLSKPIGCASPRRVLQVQRLYPEASFKPVRGNVQTRLRKLDEGEYGALILAAAGLIRLGLKERIGRVFSPEEVIPAAGQGILAVQGRAGDAVGDLLLRDGFGNADAADAALCERAFVRYLDGGCSSPVAAYAAVRDGELFLRGLYYDPADEAYITGTARGAARFGALIGADLARALRSAYPSMRTGKKGFAGALPERIFSYGEGDGPIGVIERGKVWLVGAGPGDPGLFTLKGREVLERADTVVYDALVSPGVLRMIPKGAETIHVGKRANHHTQPQHEINRILVREAKKGKRVVRLKGGDPFLFGRGGEELELLTAHGIPCEVVPGVTSALAVPAYNGIPVTHRDYCSSLHIVTGHKRQGESYDIDFDALVRTGGTLVFLMGVSALQGICEGLLSAGMPPETPAAVLQQGTTAGQKRITAAVSALAAEVKRQGVETPAIIVVGKVCALAETFAWYEKLPLAGRRILVTRPAELSSRMAAKLREKGAEVLEIPAIRTEPILPNRELYEALGRLSSYSWLVFTSPTGVRVFFEALAGEEMDLRALAGVKIAVIGSGTAKALKERGLYADLMPETYDGEALGKALAAALKPGDRVLIPRAAAGNRELVEELRKAGDVRIDDIASYETLYEDPGLIDERALIEEGKIDCAVFTSASTVKGFAAAVRGADLSKVRAVCIGRQTEEAAKALGMPTFVAERATMDSVAERAERLFLEDLQ